MTDTETDTETAETLCLSCGLCCDGSLFWAVPVAPEEAGPLSLDAEGRLRQPCACFDGACTIYPERPSACREFDCRVLQTVRAGRRDAAWARREIAAMRRLVTELAARLPGDDASVYRRAAEFLAAHSDALNDPAFQRAHRPLLKLLSDYEAALARFHVARGG